MRKGGKGKEINLGLTFEWETWKCNNVLYNKYGKAKTTRGYVLVEAFIKF